MVVIVPGLSDTLAQFLDRIVAAIPHLLTGLLFLALAYLAIKVVLYGVRSGLTRVYPPEQVLIADLIVTVLAIVLWFGAGLAFLSIVGLEGIAASFGTATGFVALGVAYALSEMIEDTVSGVYLLRDPDFNVGDRVATEKTTGTVAAIELRKTRFDSDEGDRVVVANRDVEAQWTLTGTDTE